MRQFGHYSNLVHRQPFTDTETVMPKKTLTFILAFVIGMLAVFAVIKIASSGYAFGQHLAQSKAKS
jgi:hypothetical protein